MSTSRLYLSNRILVQAFLGWFLLCFGSLYATGPFVIKPDTSVCIGEQVQLYVDQIDTVSGTSVYSFNPVPFAPEPYSGTQVVMSDDDVAGPFPIGFTFCFFGTTYTQFYIGSNGWLGFSAGQPTSFTPQPIPTTAPNTPKNCVMGPWQDWHPGLGGTISYQTTSIAPNRKLVLSFEEVPMFGCATTLGTFQIVLNEGSNLINNYIEDKPFCSWVNNAATHGIHDPSGTLAYVVNGRNATSWTTTNEGWEFIPGGPPDYQVDWLVGNTLVGSGDNITLTANSPMQVVGRLTYTCSGAVFYDTVDISVGTPPVYTVNSVGPSCGGSNDGSATVSVINGNGPFQFLWSTSPPQTTASATGLGAGTYTVSITDNVGCTVDTTITLSSPQPINLTLSTTHVTCNGADNGSITANVSGGVAPYNVQWSTGQSGSSIGNLAPGTYSATVTDDSGCQKNATANISEPLPISLTVNKTDVSCYEGSNGFISIGASGGTGPFNYNWSTGATASYIAGNSAGSYFVTVTDGNNCSVDSTIIISEPAKLEDSLAIVQPACGAASGLITALPSGGTGGYTYHWSSGQNTQAISNLIGGTYMVTITDANNCTLYDTATLVNLGNITGTLAIYHIDCYGWANGSIAASVAGGTSPYTYIWSSGQGNDSIGGLTPGTYAVTVIDALGCTWSDTALISEPADLELIMSSQDVSCYGSSDGSATMAITGGVGGYQYLWSNGAFTPTQSGLNTGTYQVSVTDGNGCTAVDSVVVSQPPQLTSSLSVTNALCAGADGSIDATIIGGSPGYIYSWSNGNVTAVNSGLSAGTYHLTVTDAKGCSITDTGVVSSLPGTLSLNTSSVPAACVGQMGTAWVIPAGGNSPYLFNWSNGQTTDTIQGVSAGTYVITVTDVNGCTAVDSVQVAPPSALQVNLTTSPVQCHGGASGSISASVSGGSPAYSYSWSVAGSGSFLSGLTAGTYTVTVTDGNGCSQTASDQITEPTPLQLSLTTTHVSCAGGVDGSITAIPAGGSAPYSYKWSIASTTSLLPNLAAGDYQVTLTDANGCNLSDSATLTEPATINLSVAIQDVSCNGAKDGIITVNASGGAGNFTYSWADGAQGNARNQLAPGSYAFTATDANGCSQSANPAVNQPAPLTVDVVTEDAICSANNGRALAQASGGTAPYQFQWNTGSAGDSIVKLKTGTYTVTVTDHNGCTDTSIGQVASKGSLEASLTIKDVLCHGGRDGSVSAVPLNGSAPYLFAWSTGSTDSILMNLPQGMYEVTVTDKYGCMDSIAANIAEPSALRLSLAGENPTCYGEKSGSINALSAGGVTPYSYSWKSGGTGNLNSNLPAGYYSVTLTDANGCETANSITLIEPPAISADAGTTQLIQEGTNASLQVTVMPPGNYTYTWSPAIHISDPNSNITTTIPDQTTVYTIKVTDIKGCTGYDTVRIVVKSPVNLFIPNAFSQNGDGRNDLFQIKGGPFDFFQLSIYNRWGSRVFHTDDAEKGWDGRYQGTPQATDTYIYIVKAIDVFGMPFTTQGNLVLLR